MGKKCEKLEQEDGRLNDTLETEDKLESEKQTKIVFQLT